MVRVVDWRTSEFNTWLLFRSPGLEGSCVHMNAIKGFSVENRDSLYRSVNCIDDICTIVEDNILPVVKCEVNEARVHRRQ